MSKFSLSKSLKHTVVYTSESTFFLIQRAFQSKLGFKISDQIKRIVTRVVGVVGVEIGQKSVTYYLNDPLCPIYSNTL
jgi:hypothetical protein